MALTETASTLSASRPHDLEEKRHFTVGRPLGGTEVRIVEKDGTKLPVEIGVKGPGVMLGYYHQPRETADSFDRDGYFLTGDLGLLSEGGCLHLVGRTGDVIIKCGFNVYPREVEARIESHPAVQEVAAVGVTDELLGEAIRACVVPVEEASSQGTRSWIGAARRSRITTSPTRSGSSTSCPARTRVRYDESSFPAGHKRRESRLEGPAALTVSAPKTAPTPSAIQRRGRGGEVSRTDNADLREKPNEHSLY